MKTIYTIIILYVCLVSCHSQTKNNKMGNDLEISLLFYPSTSINGIRYSVDIINDSVIVKKLVIDNKEYRGKLTHNQYIEIEKMASMLNQKYDRSDNFILDSWGCTLKVNDQIYYEDNFFSLIPHPEETG